MKGILARRNGVFGFEICSQHFVGVIHVFFIKIVIQKKKLIIRIHEIPDEIKPTVVNVQFANKIIWEYSGGKESLDNRTILSQHDGEYFLETFEKGEIVEKIPVADLI